MPANFCCFTRDFLLSRKTTRESQVSGGYTARVTPVPIPNTEVKPRWADDTARVTAWERRSLPGLNLIKAGLIYLRPAFCFLYELRKSVPSPILSTPLEAIAESKGNNRVILERRKLVVDFGLFRGDVGLHRGIRCCIDAIQSQGIAGASGEVEFCARRALKNSAQLDVVGEVPVLGNQVSKPKHGGRRRFHEVQLAVPGNRVRWVACVACATERKSAATRHVRCGRGAVPVVNEQARAHVKCVAQGIPIQVRFARAQIELALVRDSVVIKAAAVLKNVESASNVQPAAERNANLRASA